MDVILLERIEKLGAIGDVVKVKNGYARNFLLPNGKALRANESNRKVFEANREKIEAQNAERRGEAETESKKHRRRHDPADPSGLEHRPALRLGLGPRHRRGARGAGPQGRQEPDRPRPADQGDRRAGREDLAPPRSVGHHPRQRRPFARRGRAPGAGRRRDGRDVREGRGRLHRGFRSERRARRDRRGRREAPAAEEAAGRRATARRRAGSEKLPARAAGSEEASSGEEAREPGLIRVDQREGRPL